MVLRAQGLVVVVFFFFFLLKYSGREIIISFVNAENIKVSDTRKKKIWQKKTEKELS